MEIETATKINVGVFVAMAAVILMFAFKGAEATRLQVDCKDTSGQDCVLYAVPVRGK